MKIYSFCKPLFVQLIDNLNEEQIKYCVIGDYENLPESVGHDIDMWTNDLKKFRKCLEDAMQKTGFQPIIDNETHQCFDIVCIKKEDNGIVVAKFDIMTSTAYKSFLELYSSKEMEISIKPYKNFFVASEANEALMHFLYPMFEWGLIKKDVYKDAINQYYKDPIFLKTFESLWGHSTSEKVLLKISQRDWKGIELMMPVLRRKAIWRALQKMKTWRKMIITGYDLIRRWLRPTGVSLAFCGLDGAGKTTIIDELNNIFVGLLKPKKVFYGYWRPMVLPEIKVLLGKKVTHDPAIKELQKGKTIIEGAKKTKGVIGSTLKMLYYCLDYMLAPLRYGQIESRGGVVLFDRHYIDMVVHPLRFEMNLPQWPFLLLYKIISKPDYTFFLYCSSEEILQRKQEFSKEEIEKQIVLYTKVGKKIKGFIPIHTNTSVEDEIYEILSHIIRK